MIYVRYFLFHEKYVHSKGEHMRYVRYILFHYPLGSLISYRLWPRPTWNATITVDITNILNKGGICESLSLLALVFTNYWEIKVGNFSNYIKSTLRTTVSAVNLFPDCISVLLPSQELSIVITLNRLLKPKNI